MQGAILVENEIAGNYDPIIRGQGFIPLVISPLNPKTNVYQDAQPYFSHQYQQFLGLLVVVEVNTKEIILLVAI